MIKDVLTIVIPSKNEEDLIDVTLKLLNKQYGIVGTRVIICDSSSDSTREKINQGNYPNLKIEIIDGGTPSVARNRGAELCETPYILFLDADIFLSDPETIRDSLKTITKYCLQLVTCRFRTKGKYFWVFPTFEFFRDLMIRKSPCAIGGYMLFDVDKFRMVGGFSNEDKFAEDFHISTKISPLFFYVMDNKVYTTDRRFRKKGIFYMIKMAVLSIINKNNPEFFKNDHDYWL
jgi:glycosyltransferase involved in cell wall biosynthesis